MQFEREVKPKGIVILPKDLRDSLNFKTYDKIYLAKKGNELVITKKEEDAKEKLEQFFVYARTKNKDITLKEIKNIEEESYDLS